MSYRDKHDSGLHNSTISSYYVQAVRTVQAPIYDCLGLLAAASDCMASMTNADIHTPGEGINIE